MAHFCGFIKLIFLLLMLAQIPAREMKPLKSAAVSNSDLIAGNEFLKLFLERDQLQASDHMDSSGGSATFQFEQGDDLSEQRSLNSRSLRDQGSNGHQALIPPHQQKDEGNNNKQVVKLVTTGSKIVFLEDYDNDDAIIDAEARDIDLQKEHPIDRKKKNTTTNVDDFKVVAVSVSTSSHRDKSQVAKIQDKLNHNIAIATNKVRAMTTTKKPSVANTIAPQSKVVDLTANDNFINRSHKSELSIEEIEPYSKVQRIRRPIRIIKHHKPVSGLEGKLNGMDAQHSASTNLKRIVVIPRSASKRFSHTNAHNITTSNRDTLRNGTLNSQLAKMPEEGNGPVGEDQLLPFETVIYHDTKEGNGPQSRSISYSSISQNIQDLQKWQHTGILAEARRNVSESLKAIAARSNSTPAPPQQPESSKFYSEPSKMYSVPSKFYSEPAKVYSEPSKTYGEAEKFYSEPAKNYGEPSKIYSEPSKVYSQPAKVYSEPAKTYWPPPSNDAGVSTQATTTPATSQATPSSSRKPAIVSRIAFGEAQNSATSSTTTTTKSTITTTSTTTTTTTKPFNTYHHHHHNHHQQQQQRNFGQHNHQRHYPSANGASSSPTSPPRRIIFNLDKLPYDLLNAPEPPQQQQEQQQQRSSINPCIDAAVSTLFSTSSLSAHTGDQQQHSNQNAKRLPNEDLVKCVAEISHPTTAPNEALSYFTTERAHNEDYYTPTPEQNYEIEEAVSVMTNGRAHGLQRDGMQFGNNGGSGGVVVMTATTSPATRHSFKPMRQRVRFGTNIKPADDDDDAARNGDTTAQQQVTGSGRHGHLTQSYDGNTNAKINVAHSSNPSYKPQYNNNDNNNDRGRVHHNQNDNVNDAGVPPESYDDYEVDVVDETFDDNGEGRGAIFKSNHNYQTSVQNQHRDGSQADGQNENEEDAKVAYVVEGRNYRKYRVEEKTDDGFIVGEYGVVDHNDGNLRGVRYTADSTINRSLIQKALLTFLKLK